MKARFFSVADPDEVSFTHKPNTFRQPRSRRSRGANLPRQKSHPNPQVGEALQALTNLFQDLMGQLTKAFQAISQQLCSAHVY